MGHASSQSPAQPVCAIEKCFSDMSLVSGDAAEHALGKASVTGRYHRLPRKLAQEYRVTSKVLGSGYSGNVFVARSIQTGDKYAVKGFKLHGVSQEKLQELRDEAEIFLAMDHPHVARLVDVYESQHRLDLVMECMDGGELYQRVLEKKVFSEKAAADAVWQMLLSINYLHTHQVVHRDLKLENFLYESKDSEYLKLIDFGFSKIWSPDTKMNVSCGTLSYLAPEVISKSYTSKCDIWSLGVITFVLLVGYMPFSGSEHEQIQAIKEGKYEVRLHLWDKVSEEAWMFVKKCLVVNPDYRLSAEQALNDKWILQRHGEHSNSHFDASIADSLCKFAHASHFRRACLSVMAWSLTNQERAEVREAFIELDLDHTGVIKLVDLKDVLEKKFKVENSEIQSICEAVDMNHHDFIHYSEFLAAMVSKRIYMHDDLLASTFRRFDQNNSGFITPEDLVAVLGESLDGEDVNRMMEEVPVYTNGKISYKEFIRYLKDTPAGSKHHDVANKVIDSQLSKLPEPVRQRLSMISHSLRKFPSKRASGEPWEISGQQQPQHATCCVTM